MDKYRLTTDHSASSYGIPVLVDDQNVAYGPADILYTGTTVCGEYYAVSAIEWVMQNVLPYTHPDHALGKIFIGEKA